MERGDDGAVVGAELELLAFDGGTVAERNGIRRVLRWLEEQLNYDSLE
jgi:hypothetical protein